MINIKIGDKVFVKWTEGEEIGTILDQNDLYLLLKKTDKKLFSIYRPDIIFLRRIEDKTKRCKNG